MAGDCLHQKSNRKKQKREKLFHCFDFEAILNTTITSSDRFAPVKSAFLNTGTVSTFAKGNPTHPGYVMIPSNPFSLSLQLYIMWIITDKALLVAQKSILKRSSTILRYCCAIDCPHVICPVASSQLLQKTLKTLFSFCC